MIGFDSYGWIGRLTNGPKAKTYNEIIDLVRADEIVTYVVVLYEVYRKVKKTKG